LKSGTDSPALPVEQALQILVWRVQQALNVDVIVPLTAGHDDGCSYIGELLMRHLLALFVVVGFVFALIGRSRVIAQDATPAVSPSILVEALIPASSIPPAPSRLFFLAHDTFAPGATRCREQRTTCAARGPQFEHVLAGELTLRVEGPLQVQRASSLGMPGPVEEIEPGTEVTMGPGDTAIYQTQLTAEYANRGTEPMQFIRSALFPEPPPGPTIDESVGVTTEAIEFNYPVPSPPPGPLVATLQQATLSPDGWLPAVPDDVLRIVIAAPGSPAVVTANDGTIQNTSDVPAIIYALMLRPAEDEAATPAS
jgi:hypothetical protein